MSAFDKLFGKFKVKKELGNFFAMLDGYTPVFTTYDGGVYEMELTRSCIHTFASHCSKLQPEVTGPDSEGLKAMLNGKPNLFMTSSQFLYKTATIYEAQNTSFIVPIVNSFDQLVGFYPVAPSSTELREHGGVVYLVYTFGNGERAAIELERVGAVSKFLYNHDLVGEDNSALSPTMQLLNTQNKGIEEGIKNSASFRFMATTNNFLKGKDLANERKNWVENNLSADAGGLALFPSNYTNVQQVQSTAKIVDPEQVKLIQGRVYTYFGTNEDVLLNKAVGDGWSAYYEGKIEPFAIQLSQAMTVMTFNEKQRTGKKARAIVWSANRLQYMTNADKLQVSSQMFDRDILSVNDVMDIWNLPHVEDGDKRYIRKEYAEVSQLDEVSKLQAELTATQNALNAAQKPEPVEDPEKNKEYPIDDPE